MRRFVRIGCVLLALAALALLAFVAAGWRSAIAPVAPPQRGDFPAELLARGANLAALGGCANCHTREGGEPFAGGVPITTAFGTLFGNNITPSVQHGIGDWSAAAFRRAMRQGVGRSGRHLYPAFPYDHYARLTDGDIDALYAFVMTRDPAAVPSPPHALRFPFGWRPLLQGWKWLYLDGAPFRPDPSADAALNRGAYLVHGLAHCGACHTPRDALGGEVGSRPLAGGESAGWYAPPLDASSPSPLPWTAAKLNEYLRTGLTEGHAIAGGPMQPVVARLAEAEPDDVAAITQYILATLGPATAERSQRERTARQRAARPALAADGAQDAEMPAPAAGGGGNRTPLPVAASLRLGAEVYAGACASCHDLGRQLSSGSGLRLPLAVAVHEDDPRSLLRIVRDGILPPPGSAGRWMPAYGHSLGDAQLEALAAYLRSQAAGAPPWPKLAEAVRDSGREPPR